MATNAPRLVLMARPRRCSTPLLRSANLQMLVPKRRFSAITPKYQNRAVRQPPHADSINFPGALNSKFTSELKFKSPNDTPAITTYRLMDTDGVVIDKANEPVVDKEKAVKMYRDMVAVSIMDLIMYDSQRQGRISFYMVSAGEEGVAVGSAAALDPDDVLFSQYREQGVLLYRGFTFDEFMNQLFANKYDYGKGRNMPIHYQSERLRLHSISSPLATQIPHAVGAAYALKQEGSSNVAVCYFGEGAASEGDFHAALNIAATRACPVIFICRNNGFAISTPTLEQYKGDGIASRGMGYGIETIRVDGNDIWAVYEVTKRAREIAFTQQKPVLIEAMSYRVSHHSTSDDSFAYRAKDEVEDWKRRDNPITRMRKFLCLRDWWSPEEDAELRSALRKQILQAFTKAEKLKKPSIDNLFLDIFEEPSPDLKEQQAQLKEILEKYPNEYDLDSFEGGKDAL
ncbi:thiamine diphosphate-binding protein [Peziza echinospora]|nr:thiamine diphosphate-binding protein [Peziza echinospora]